MDASMGDATPILPTQTTDSIKATMMSSSPTGPERTSCSRPFKELSLANIPSTTMPMETTLSVEKSVSSSSDLQQDAENTPPPQTDIGVPNSSNPLQGDVVLNVQQILDSIQNPFLIQFYCPKYPVKNIVGLISPCVVIQDYKYKPITHSTSSRKDTIILILNKIHYGMIKVVGHKQLHSLYEQNEDENEDGDSFRIHERLLNRYLTTNIGETESPLHQQETNKLKALVTSVVAKYNTLSEQAKQELRYESNKVTKKDSTKNSKQPKNTFHAKTVTSKTFQVTSKNYFSASVATPSPRAILGGTSFRSSKRTCTKPSATTLNPITPVSSYKKKTVIRKKRPDKLPIRSLSMTSPLGNHNSNRKLEKKKEAKGFFSYISVGDAISYRSPEDGRVVESQVLHLGTNPTCNTPRACRQMRLTDGMVLYHDDIVYVSRRFLYGKWHINCHPETWQQVSRLCEYSHPSNLTVLPELRTHSDTITNPIVSSFETSNKENSCYINQASTFPSLLDEASAINALLTMQQSKDQI